MGSSLDLDNKGIELTSPDSNRIVDLPEQSDALSCEISNTSSSSSVQLPTQPIDKGTLQTPSPDGTTSIPNEAGIISTLQTEIPSTVQLPEAEGTICKVATSNEETIPVPSDVGTIPTLNPGSPTDPNLPSQIADGKVRINQGDELGYLESKLGLGLGTDGQTIQVKVDGVTVKYNVDTLYVDFGTIDHDQLLNFDQEEHLKPDGTTVINNGGVLSLNPLNIDHDTLFNFVQNEHLEPDQDSIIINAQNKLEVDYTKIPSADIPADNDSIVVEGGVLVARRVNNHDIYEDVPLGALFTDTQNPQSDDWNINNSNISFTTSGAFLLNTKIDNHINSDGTDHSYIDQDVTMTSEPEFKSVIYADNTTLPSYFPGKLFYDPNVEEISFYGQNSGTIIRTSTETLVRVKNESGADMTIGQAVYGSGVSVIDGLPLVLLAQANQYSTSRPLAVIKENIPNNTAGLATLTGVVEGFDTSTLSGGSVYLSTTNAGELTSVKPSNGNFVVRVGGVYVSDAVNGKIVVNPTINEETAELSLYTGYPKPNNISIGLDFGTRTISLNPITGSDYYFYQDGIKYIKTSDSFIFSADEGIHSIYYDQGILTEFVNPTQNQLRDIKGTYPGLVNLYWSVSQNAVIFINDERHTFDMNGETKTAFLDYHGCTILEGVDLTDIIVNGTGNLDEHAQFGHTSGLLRNEDIITSVSNELSTTGITIFYKEGVNEWKQTMRSGFSVLNAPLGRIYWNENIGGVWQLTEAGNGNIVPYYVVASNTLGDKVATIPGIAEYSTIADAEAGAISDFLSVFTSLPLKEIAGVAIVFFQTRNNYSNTVKGRIIPTVEGFDYISLKDTSLTGNGSGGSQTLRFEDLLNTPSSLTSFANNLLFVSSTETGIEFRIGTTDSIPEGSNLYYTEARVSANTDVAANTQSRHNAVEATGESYVTLVDQNFTFNKINLGSNVTGILNVANGGTGISNFDPFNIARTNVNNNFSVTQTGTSFNATSNLQTNGITRIDSSGNFIGNGASLTNLNASNISTGTLADGNLSSNVALKNQANVFTQNQSIFTNSTGGSWLFIKDSETSLGMQLGFNSAEEANLFVAENKPLIFGTNNLSRAIIPASGGFNLISGSYQTNGTTRIDNLGNFTGGRYAQVSHSSNPYIRFTGTGRNWDLNGNESIFAITDNTAGINAFTLDKITGNANLYGDLDIGGNFTGGSGTFRDNVTVTGISTGSKQIKVETQGNGTASMVVSDASGGVNLFRADSGDSYFNGTGGVAIGSTSTSYKLGVTGSFGVTGNGTFSGEINVGTNRIRLAADGTLFWGASADYGRLSWNTGEAIITSQGSNSLVLQHQGSKKLETTSTGIDITGNVVASGTLTTDGLITTGGYQQNYPEDGFWRTNRTYVYDSTNGTRYYWMKLATGTSGTGSALIEYHAKDDANYSNSVSGRIIVSSWSGSSFSIQHDTTSPNNGLTPVVRVDSSKNVWLQVYGCDWTHWFRYRFIFRQSAGVSSVANDVKQEATPTNSVAIYAGQQLRVAEADLGSMSSQSPSNTRQYFGGIASRDTITALGGDSSQWNTAYGWGDHSGLYFRKDSEMIGESNTGDFVSKRLVGTGIGDSYDERVVLLLPKSEIATSYDNRMNGKLTAGKTGGNVIDFFEIQASSVYNNTFISFSSDGQRNGHKLVTCTYNGVKWLALKFQYTANPYNYFMYQGMYKASPVLDTNGDGLKVISYADLQSGTVILNAEIYNSIADYTPNSNWYYNGNKIFHGGNFTDNSSNWNTAYSYSQVGHLPLTGGTITNNTSGRPLKIISGTTNGGGIGIEFSDQTVYAQKGYIDFYHQDSANAIGAGAVFKLQSTESVFSTQLITNGGNFFVNNNAVYHTGNKPTASDVGAIPNNGTWTGGSGSPYTTLFASYKNTGNGKFTFYCDSGSMDVIADGQFYANEGNYKVWNEADFSSTNINNWNTAYGWGNHASAGYLTSSTGSKGFSGSGSTGSTSLRWYRIAKATGGSPAGAIFTVRGTRSSNHSICVFAVTASYGQNPSISLISSSPYGAIGINKIRLEYGSTYDEYDVMVQSDADWIHYECTANYGFSDSFVANDTADRNGIEIDITSGDKISDTVGGYVYSNGTKVSVEGHTHSTLGGISTFTFSNGMKLDSYDAVSNESIKLVGADGAFTNFILTNPLQNDEALISLISNSYLAFNYKDTSIFMNGSNITMQTKNGAGTVDFETYGLTYSSKMGTARSEYNAGMQIGAYNYDATAGTRSDTSNPIFVLGKDYRPEVSTLGNMYGIGYTYTNSSFISGSLLNGGTGWGAYVAADGDARIFLNGSTGSISCTNSIYAGGSITATGDVTAFSDRRLKENIKPIKNALETVTQLEGVTYTRNDLKDNRVHIGWIAQDVEKIAPELVVTNEDKMRTKSINYAQSTALLSEAIKEQQELILKLNKRIDTQQKLLERLIKSIK